MKNTRVMFYKKNAKKYAMKKLHMLQTVRLLANDILTL